MCELCQLDSIADIVINSSFVVLLLRILAKSTALSMRLLIITLLGVLIRHANTIFPDTDEGSRDGASGGAPGDSSLLSTLAMLTRDDDHRVRARAMASLGELLFYISTFDEQDEGTNGASDSFESGSVTRHPRWQVPFDVIQCVARCLQEGEDNIACHYAAKTIENILVQGLPLHTCRYATEEIAARLLDLTNRHSSGTDDGEQCGIFLWSQPTSTLLFASLGQSGTLVLSHVHGSFGCCRAWGLLLLLLDCVHPASTAESLSELRATAASALAHMLRHMVIDEAPHLVPTPETSASATSAALGTDTGGHRCRIIPRVFGSQRVAVGVIVSNALSQTANEQCQTTHLNLLNALLKECFSIAGVSSTLDAETEFLLSQLTSIKVVSALVRLFDRTPWESCRAKVALSIQLLARVQPATLVDALERGLLPKLDRLLSTNMGDRKYLRACVASLLSFLCSAVGTCSRALREDVDRCVLLKSTAPRAGTLESGDGTSSLKAFPAVAHVVASNTLIRIAVEDAPGFLDDLSVCSNATVVNPGDDVMDLDARWARLRATQEPSSRVRAETQRLLLLIWQGLARHTHLVFVPRIKEFVEHGLPSICCLLADQNGDTRANAISILRLILPTMAATTNAPGGKPGDGMYLAPSSSRVLRARLFVG